MHRTLPRLRSTSNAGAAAQHAAASSAVPRVAIIGAGIAGPALAVLLQSRLGWIPHVFESADALREVGAGISLAPNGMRVLESLGLADYLVNKASIINKWLR